MEKSSRMLHSAPNYENHLRNHVVVVFLTQLIAENAKKPNDKNPGSDKPFLGEKGCHSWCAAVERNLF